MEIDKIATLSLQPDDVLVLNYGGKLSEKLHVSLQESLRRIKLVNQVIILEQEMTLQVLKPALKWTSDLPTQEGWYWHKMSEDSTLRALQVSKCAGHFIVDDPDEVIFVRDVAGEWCGPIEPPEYL